MKEMFLLIKISDSDNFLIGRLIEETEDDVIIQYPITIRLQPNSLGTTSVSTTKMMPFSMNNLVAIRKQTIIAISKPNIKVIDYYKNFVEKFSKIYDEVLENDILGIKSDELDIEEDGLTLEVKGSGSSVH